MNRFEIPGYRLIVSGDESGDGLFDFCHDLHERGVFWILQHFVNGEIVDEETSTDYAERIDDGHQLTLDIFHDRMTGLQS